MYTVLLIAVIATEFQKLQQSTSTKEFNAYIYQQTLQQTLLSVSTKRWLICYHELKRALDNILGNCSVEVNEVKYPLLGPGKPCTFCDFWYIMLCYLVFFSTIFLLIRHGFVLHGIKNKK